MKSAGIDELAMVEFRTGFSAADSTADVALDCFEVTAPWSPGTADWSEVWTSPGGDFDRASYVLCAAAACDSSAIAFDVTDMVASWKGTDVDNHGILIARAPGEEAVFQMARGAVGEAVSSVQLTIWYTPRRSEQ
ncbi:MAG: hypothetical protein GF400_09785 [Candidatus Eisenbacteria bacterium]|nr:hypothetical protein [Candidatus Eisenbacteria bacterium]